MSDDNINELEEFNEAVNKRFFENSDKFWVLNDDNFEEVKEMADNTKSSQYNHIFNNRY